MAFLSKYTCRWRDLAFGIESRGDLGGFAARAVVLQAGALKKNVSKSRISFSRRRFPLYYTSANRGHIRTRNLRRVHPDRHLL
jgi:hypothetical protein